MSAWGHWKVGAMMLKLAELPCCVPCAGAVLSLAQTQRGRPQTTSTPLYAGGELQGSPVW